MLLTLALKDFVIVENLNLDFQSGFTVLTGETGAGKSITLDALSLLLGDKADYSQVRNGAQEAQLSALFDISELSLLKIQLREQGLLEENTEDLSIRRIIDIKGKSRSFINNHAVTLSQLKCIGEQLIDIHGQNTHQSLNQEATQRQLLDAFSGCVEQANLVKQHYHNWLQAKKNLHEAKSQTHSITLKREQLEWQFNELEQLNLQDGEWETLSQSYDTLAHANELLQVAEQINNTIDDEKGLQHQIYQCQKLLSNLQNISPKFNESLVIFNSIEAEFSEISANMRDVISDTDINSNELIKQEQRMNELMNMARKYHIEPQELPKQLSLIHEELKNLEAAADLEALEANVLRIEAEYNQAAQTLSAMRHKGAAQLSNETTEYMQNLAMKGAQFNIALLPSSPTVHGLEQIQYQVAINQGSLLRPLNKVASGGELARISLAIQVVTSQYTHVPTLIFDEVDTGIGGGVAEIVGKALRSLGKKCQVLAITHLPQVASYGENHWQVYKYNNGVQTVSQINILSHHQRIDEIARMLGGEVITEITKNHAEELLNLAA